ncbi:MAG TPA: cupin domain-containing protein [bacterium]|nr:cupin domain-containing protein [bacterium]
MAALILAASISGVAWAQAAGMKVTTVLQTSTTPAGQPIQFPLFRNQLIARVVEIAPGGQSGRHMHPLPVLVYVLEGELTVEADGQPARTYTTGQAAAEVVNIWHNATNRGAVPLKFLVVFTGQEGQPTAVTP